MSELTGPQLAAAPLGSILVATDGGKYRLPRSLPATYATYREERKDPTISLVRTLIASGIVSAGWTYNVKDGARDAWKNFVEDQLEPRRPDLVEKAVLGGIDFGWSPFEKAFRVANGRIVIDKIKSLLQDITNIFVDENGNFTGFDQPFGRRPVFVPFGNGITPASRALLVPWRVEGTYWYGYPLLENARDVWTAWTTADEQAETFDAKVVGSRIVVYYPPGTTLIDGVETENADIAQTIIDALETSGSVGVPTTVAKYVDELDKNSTGWRIQSIEGRGEAPFIMDRLNYLDVLKVRALGMPERTVLHGAQEGAKVGTETAQTFAIRNLEMMGAYVAKLVNAYLTDQLLYLNGGESAVGSVFVKAAPILDETKAYLADIAADVLKGQPDLADMDSVFDTVGIPKAEQTITARPIETGGEQ